MSTLNQVITFTAVGAGSQATQTHAISLNGIATLPDLLYPDNDNFSFVSATTTTITVINNSSGPLTLHLWCQLQHSIDKAYGASSITHLTPQPFWVGGGVTGGGGGGGSPIVESIINSSGGTILAGSPVTASGNSASDTDSTPIIGIAQETALSNAPVAVQTNGSLTLGADQWHQVTGEVLGLTPHAPYYVADPLHVTMNGPNQSTKFVKPVGVAITATSMLIAPSPTVSTPGASVSVFPIKAALLSGTFAATMQQINQIDPSIESNVVATLPAANSVPNGTWTIILFIVDEANHDLTISIEQPEPDTINYSANPAVFNIESDASVTIIYWLVSDGISNWLTIQQIQSLS